MLVKGATGRQGSLGPDLTISIKPLMTSETVWFWVATKPLPKLMWLILKTWPQWIEFSMNNGSNGRNERLSRVVIFVQSSCCETHHRRIFLCWIIMIHDTSYMMLSVRNNDTPWRVVLSGRSYRWHQLAGRHSLASVAFPITLLQGTRKQSMETSCVAHDQLHPASLTFEQTNCPTRCRTKRWHSLAAWVLGHHCGFRQCNTCLSSVFLIWNVAFSSSVHFVSKCRVIANRYFADRLSDMLQNSQAFSCQKRGCNFTHLEWARAWRITRKVTKF